MLLNDIKRINKLDTGRVAESIALLPDQVRQVLGEARLIKIPREYSRVTQVVINGMGGSNIGAGIVKSAFADRLKVPISIVPGYFVPAHVNKNTLYLVSSYSGSTEEPLRAYQEAKKRGAKITAITSRGRGKLEKLMLKNNIPGYIFAPKYNPSGQPRLALGYSLFGIAVLLAKVGLLKVKVEEMENIIASMEIGSRKLKPEEPLAANAAKKIALDINTKIPVLIGAEHIMGNVRAMRNQINESSKHFAVYLNLPDLNHYAMEGLANPASNEKNLIFIFFDSSLYHPRVRKRGQLTKKVVKKNGIRVISHGLKWSGKPAQAFELLQLGTWVSYYLGILNGADPVKIPWVNWFKKQLKRP